MLTLPLGTRVLLAPEEPHQGDLQPLPGAKPSAWGRLHLTELGVTEDVVVDSDE